MIVGRDRPGRDMTLFSSNKEVEEMGSATSLDSPKRIILTATLFPSFLSIVKEEKAWERVCPNGWSRQ